MADVETSAGALQRNAATAVPESGLLVSSARTITSCGANPSISRRIDKLTLERNNICN